MYHQIKIQRSDKQKTTIQSKIVILNIKLYCLAHLILWLAFKARLIRF